MHGTKVLSSIFMLMNAFVFAAPAIAEQRMTGAGIILGEPSGLSLKLGLENGHALTTAFAWSLRKNKDFYVHADYLLGETGFTTVGYPHFYYGVGGRITRFETPVVGVRIPLGLTYPFVSVPLEVFGELVPTLDVFPSTDAMLGAGIGVRYLFDKK